jgi:hypothetical protein
MNEMNLLKSMEIAPSRRSVFVKHELSNSLIEEELPHQWEESFIVPIRKKGHKTVAAWRSVVSFKPWPPYLQCPFGRRLSEHQNFPAGRRGKC